MPVLLILFIAVPIAEIALFIEIGGLIGLWPTLATILVTALVGATLVRAQGLAALSRAQAALAEDRFPVEEVVTGVCLLIAGALLLTPGFLTDALGFALLIPPLRRSIGAALIRTAQRSPRFTMQGGPAGGPGPQGPGDPRRDPRRDSRGGPRRGPDGRPIIDGEFQEVDPEGAAEPRESDRLHPPRDEPEDPPEETRR
ncbi:MAG: FxsA family protein [Alphaproteobacteria bacterium]|nr:FxsA family protein [Alphaproteobacteria bacterium]